MRKPDCVEFPRGVYGKKIKCLERGFGLLGIRTDAAPLVEKTRAVPVVLVYGSEKIKTFIDISVKANEIVEKYADGRAFYFKTHLNPAIAVEGRRIFPMPQTLGQMEFLDMIPKLRALRAGHEPKIDVFGVFTAGNLRSQACRIVLGLGLKRALVGINKSRGKANLIPKDLRTPRIVSGAYFRMMAESRAALSIPSCRGAWCSFRSVEAWSLGVPMLTVPPDNYVVFGNPERCWIETRADLSDLGAMIGWTLDHKDKAREIGIRGMEYFDRFLRPERHAEHILRTVENGR